MTFYKSINDLKMIKLTGILKIMFVDFKQLSKKNFKREDFLDNFESVANSYQKVCTSI